MIGKSVPRSEWSKTMKSQSEVERMLREIHVMVAQGGVVAGDDDQVSLNKTQLFDALERINLCMYDMMDQYELTEKSKSKAVLKVKDQTDVLFEDASQKAEDIYSASIMYSDDAIGRVVRILEDAQTSMDETMRKAQWLVEEEKSIIRMNQRELQDQLMEMQDAKIYLNLIEERRRRTEIINTEKRVVTKELSRAVISQLQSASGKFPGMGDDFKKEAVEVKVNLNSEYFRRKNGEKDGKAKED